MAVNTSGRFIVFEGGDGVGKTTQVRLLCDWLVRTARPHLQTFEPGDSVAGGQIRRILLDPETGELAPKAEALLYAADKAHHLEAVVRPALQRDEIVVCDRYVDSMLAYQGAGRVLAMEPVEKMARWATDDLRPDLTILLDGDPGDLVGALQQPDRIESAGGAFHRTVREHFLALAARDPGHYLVLPARDDPETIAAAVRDRMAGLLDG